MFLEAIILRNKELIKVAHNLHSRGKLEPDTYVLDFDSIMENAKLILEEAKKYNIEAFFITKQIGFNPEIARALINLGYSGAVCVDYKEMDVMLRNNIKVMHVGHLVQIPKQMLQKAVCNVEYITVYSIEKAKEINEEAQKNNKVQKIYLRVIEKDDVIYEGQSGGFLLQELEGIIENLKTLENIKIVGLTSFPCFLYNSKTRRIEETNNVNTLKKAKTIIESLGVKIDIINLPSSTCCANIKFVSEIGGTQVEVGHGLSGTTPLHSIDFQQKEIPAILYLSEISHNYGDNSYFYGGGYYRRGFLQNILLGRDIEEDNFKNLKKVNEIDNTAIDYYLSAKGNYEISQSVIASFRTQIFVTRSKVALISGIRSGKSKILGVYNSVGDKIK